MRLKKLRSYFFYFCAMNKTSILKWIFLILAGCCACKNLTINKSSATLPIDSVAAIVADCFFLESVIHVQQWKYDISDYSFIKYDSLFKKRGISKEVFVKNVEYYITNKKFTDRFLDKVDKIVEQRVTVLRDSLKL